MPHCNACHDERERKGVANGWVGGMTCDPYLSIYNMADFSHHCGGVCLRRRRVVRVEGDKIIRLFFGRPVLFCRNETRSILQ